MIESRTLGLVFANMQDQYIGELTHKRTTASVPFGGRYRLIDFTLSNMVNAGITNIGVITKNNYNSLMDHLGSGRDWDLARKRGGLIILPPYSNAHLGVYRGSLDALAGALGFIQHSTCKYVIMADCDVIANMDLKAVVDSHIATGAQITLVYHKHFHNQGEPGALTALGLDDQHRVTDIQLEPPREGEYNAYLDIAVMEKSMLENIIMDAMSHNKMSFRRDYLLENYRNVKIYGYEYTGFAATIGSMRAYYETNLALLEHSVARELFRSDRPIHTKVRDEVPAKYETGASASNCLVADGCVIAGTVENSVIFRGVTIGKGAVVRDSVIMQGTVIGEGATLECVVCDKDVSINAGRSIMGFKTYPVYIEKGTIV